MCFVSANEWVTGNFALDICIQQMYELIACYIIKLQIKIIK